jgi:serine/threonine protein kinase
VLTNSQDFIGQALGTCTLKRLIGRGGMGAVYLAQQSRPRRTVAVKVLLPNLVEDHPREEFLARFRREADAIAALDHINIMPIYEYGEQEDTAFLVMPYITGGTLRDHLEKQSIPPLEEIVQIIEQASAGLDAAHAQGIIHRDLKPGNILFHGDGRILLADFGLAKVLKETAEDSGVSVLTSTGTIVGTPEYLSPEQGAGDTLDYRTDVYSLGVVLYQMLAGRVPFVGTSPVAVAIKHTLEIPPPVTRFNPQVPRSIEAVVMKALAKKPDERFSSAGEMARALRLAASTDQATRVWHPSSPTHSQRLPAVAPKQPKPRVPPIQASPVREERKPELSTAEVRLDEVPQLNFEIKNTDQQQGQQPAEIKEARETPRVPSLKDQVTALPTMLMHQNEEPHAAMTEAAPPLPVRESPVTSLPTLITTADPTVADQQAPRQYLDAVEQRVPGPAPQQQPLPRPHAQEPVMEVRVLADQKPLRPPTLSRPFTQPFREGRSERRGGMPMRAVLITSVVVLLVVVGSLFVYLQSMTKHDTDNPITHVTPAASVTATAGPTKEPTAQEAAAPSLGSLPAVVNPSLQHGQRVYGSVFPMCYPQQEGSWEKLGSGTAECIKGQGLHMANNSGSRTGVFLEGKSIPDDFAIQVQITIKPGATGGFGIFYRSQQKDHWKSYVYMIEPVGGGWTWTAYVSQTGENGFTRLNSEPVPTNTSIEGTITISMHIQDTDYSYYINDQNFDPGAISGGQYSSGTIGFAADPGADVTFKNLAVYTLS